MASRQRTDRFSVSDGMLVHALSFPSAPRKREPRRPKEGRLDKGRGIQRDQTGVDGMGCSATGGALEWFRFRDATFWANDPLLARCS